MAEFHCTATGNPVPEITWIKDGQSMKKGETLSFTVNRNQSGQYWCSADNGFNTIANASAYLDVLCEYKGYVSVSTHSRKSRIVHWLPPFKQEVQLLQKGGNSQV